MYKFVSRFVIALVFTITTTLFYFHSSFVTPAYAQQSAGCTSVNNGDLNLNRSNGAGGPAVSINAAFDAGDLLTVTLINAANSYASIGTLILFNGTTGDATASYRIKTAQTLLIQSDILAQAAVASSIIWTCTSIFSEAILSQTKGASVVLDGTLHKGPGPTKLTTPAPNSAPSGAGSDLDGIRDAKKKFADIRNEFNRALSNYDADTVSAYEIRAANPGFTNSPGLDTPIEHEDIFDLLAAIDRVNAIITELNAIERRYLELLNSPPPANSAQAATRLSNIAALKAAINDVNADINRFKRNSATDRIQRDWVGHLPKPNISQPDLAPLSGNSSEGEALLYAEQRQPTEAEEAIKDNFGFTYFLPGFAYQSADGSVRTQAFAQLRYSRLISDIEGYGFDGRLGLVTDFGNRWVAGAYVSANSGETLIQSTGFELDRSGIGFGVYSEFTRDEQTAITFSTAFTKFSNDVKVVGATGSFDSSLFVGDIGVSKDKYVGDKLLTLNATIGFANRQSDAYALSSGTPVSASDATALTASLGAKLSKDIVINSAMFPTGKPYISAGIGYDSKTEDVTSGTITAVELNKISGSVGGGITLSGVNGSTLDIGGEISGIGNSTQSVGATVRLRIPLN